MDLTTQEKELLEDALRELIQVGADVGQDLYITAINDDGQTLTFSDGREYYLQEIDDDNLRYWPEEMQSDYDMLDVWVADGSMLYGS